MCLFVYSDGASVVHPTTVCFMCSSVIAHSAFTIRRMLHNVPLMIMHDECVVLSFCYEILLPLGLSCITMSGIFFIYRWSFKVLVELSRHWITLDDDGNNIIIIIIIIVLAPLCRVFTIICLKQTMFLGCCCSCSIFTICATWNVTSRMKCVLNFYIHTFRSI